jgi:hypothetical protein
MKRRWVVLAPLVIVGILVFVAIGGGIVLLLWNWLLPSLFGWRPITFGQAVGILALCRILFGGFGAHGSGRSNLRRRLAERWERLTPEERERLRRGIRERCGFGPPPRESEGQ